MDIFSFEWLKAFHIIAMVSWFAGLFYLPRLFVYHAATTELAVHEQFCIMESKLYRFIMQPAMGVTVVLGLMMAVMNWAVLADQVWFYLKILLVVGLIYYHFHCGKIVKIFADNENKRSHKFYRMYNEIPTLGLIAVVIFVVVRPF
ncbi:MAG: protoporphyrinogen oxidase HemJ [Zetaproteobacteria bacterium]|nr:protoporphyrinogen oxidase HemJ [Zetaproteobacteria bacterium]